MPVTVVIAARDEEASVAAAVESAFACGAAEVIVADGASSDATRAAAAASGARVIECEPMRSRQFNRGAEAATNAVLIFLHADTRLPAGAAAAVEDALQNHEFGGFRIAFAERKLRLVAILINLRTRLTRCPWGDQAQFIRRNTFFREGGFREIPLMEDYDLAVRMRRRSTLLPLTVITSGRRFLQLGPLRTAVLNWTIVVAWRVGVSPERLARWYRA